ncbi:MAG: extracellular solute-binding protein [Lachnospiraceae bacterium]|nr:extracellular solute-binding protein [Lachnospiraceae bacterium]
MRKRLFALLLAACALTTLVGCGQTKERAASGELVLRVANCEEYIDLGDWDEDEAIELEDGTVIFGENSLVDDFETWYEETYGQKIRVEYSTYGTNEELYNQMSLGDVFDVVCPSEYMIMKLMKEGRLVPLSDEFFNEDTEENYYSRYASDYIKGVFTDLNMGGETISKYAGCYMWGTLGIVYNPELVEEGDADHYAFLKNPTYSKRVTMKDSIRDSYFAGLAIRNESDLQTPEFIAQEDYREELSERMNDTSVETVQEVEDILSDMRTNAYSLETDSGKADLVTGKVVASLQWSGDAVYTMDQAEEDGVELAYSVPEECTNLWFDGWVMMKNGIAQDARKQQAAEAFINFLSRPDNAVRNMYYIGYTSPIAGDADNNLVYQYLDYNYGAEEDEEDVVDYDLSYFFGEDADNTITAPASQMNRQLFTQYPPEDVLHRSVVMRYFEGDANDRIAQMWTNIRCFDLQKLFQ